MVQRVSRGHGADEDEHDQTHAFLAVVRTVEETDASAGEHQQAANLERRWRAAFGRLVQLLVLHQDFGHHQQ